MRDIERLLRGRRARRRFTRLSTRPSDEEAELLRMGIELSALRPGADAPRDEFLRGLRDKIAESAAATDHGVGPAGTSSTEAAGTPRAGRRGFRMTAVVPGTAGSAQDRGPRPFHGPGDREPHLDGRPVETARGRGPWAGRRGFLAGASVAAASAVAAVAVDQAVSGGQDRQGVWHRVLAAQDLKAGGVQAFQAGAVSGFVTRRPDGRLSAVSGACTHLGCRLSLSGDAARLDCPCHSTSFAVTGEVVRKQLPIALPPLPRFEVRESGGHIEVFVPL